MTETMKRAALVAGIKSIVPSDEEIARARANLEIGKGSNDRPFISADAPLPLSEPINAADAADPLAAGDFAAEEVEDEDEPRSASEAPAETAPPTRKMKTTEKYRNWRIDPSALKKE